MENQGGGAPFRLEEFTTIDLHEAEIESKQLVAFSSYDSRSRGFNLLRTTLTKQLSKERALLFGLTSATPAAGKTFLSINLAASLSRVSEAPVYLIDLDLRMASVAKALEMNIESGIEKYLVDPNCDDLQKFGVRIGDTNLVVFPSARIAGNSAELMSSSNYQQFIEALRARTAGSYVLFDLPPAFANDDAMLSVGQLDGYILVADSGKTTKEQVRELHRAMRPAVCLGSILNRYRGGFADSYGYGSDAYDSYYR